MTPLSTPATQPQEQQQQTAKVEAKRTLGAERPTCFDCTDYTLGGSVLKAHGITPDGETFYLRSYAGATLDEQGRAVPFTISPDPSDSMLSIQAVPSLAPGESAICSVLPPDFEDYLRRQGLLDRTSRVVQVPHTAGGTAYPFRDQLLGAAKAEMDFAGAHLVFTFPNAHAFSFAEQLRFTPVQLSEATHCNNKAEFREAMQKAGVPVFPGGVLNSEADIYRICEELAVYDRGKGFVVKLAHGAGGDTVKISHSEITPSNVLARIEELRSVVQEAFDLGSYDPAVREDYWPTDSLLPSGSKIIFELHADNLGEVLLNGSNTILVNQDGSYNVMHYYQQITDEGIFLGSAPLFLEAQDRALLENSMALVADHCRSLNLFGLVGVDFMLVQEGDKLVPYLYELNGRPSSSAVAHRLADKLGAPYFINTAFKAVSAEVNSIADFERLLKSNPLTADLFDGEHERVVLTAPYAVWNLNEEGQPVLEQGHHKFKAMVVSHRSQEHCREARQRMIESGVFA